MIGAGENQGLAASAIVLGYGFITSLIGLVISLFVVRFLNNRQVTRLIFGLAVLICGFILFYYYLGYRQRSKAKNIENQIKEANKIILPSEEPLNPKFDPIIVKEYNGIPDSVPYGPNPKTPSQKALESASHIKDDDLNVVDGKSYLEDELFSGWTAQIFKDNPHRYRYTMYNKGKKVWQIGYFENGQLDHDFHVFQDKNKGSQRMWREDGSPYIDNFFLEGGILHGIQKRWYSNHRLAMESKYEHGVQLYKKEFNKSGHMMRQE